MEPALDAASIARLHGEACWDCGAVATTLHPAGEVRLESGKVWKIRKCITHRPLSEAQWRREACYYCGDPLDLRTAMEVGQRMVRWQGRWASILPRRHAGCGGGQ